MIGARELAWRVLTEESEAPLRQVERRCAEEGLAARDRALVRRLVGTALRRRGSLEAILRAFTKRPPAPELAVHVQLGLVQLFFLDRVPDHAAVSATCDAVARTVGQKGVPFVHGVLRAAARERRPGISGDPRRDLVGRELHLERAVFRDPTRAPFLWAEDALSLPAWLIERWTGRFGNERTEELARFFLQEPPLALRTVRFEREEALDALQNEGIEAKPGRSNDAIICAPDATAKVLASELFRSGRVTVQGEAAREPARLLAPRPGERALELCAAPGGKTAQLAESGATVVACDLDLERLRRLVETLRRLRVGEAVQLVICDGASGIRELSFDAALVDAPCSNTGVLGARPEARWRFTPSALESLARLQTRLFSEAAEKVRPGGRLVWSTCSLEPEENEERVCAFLAVHKDWELEEERSILPDPETGPWDGGYAARLRRAAVARCA